MAPVFLAALVLGLSCHWHISVPCGPRTEMARVFLATLVLGLSCHWYFSVPCGPRTEMACQNIDHCGPRTTMDIVYGMVLGLRCHFRWCHAGPKATIVVLGTISQVRTTMAISHSGPRTRRAGPDGLVLWHRVGRGLTTNMRFYRMSWTSGACDGIPSKLTHVILHVWLGVSALPRPVVDRGHIEIEQVFFFAHLYFSIMGMCIGDG